MKTKIKLLYLIALAIMTAASEKTNAQTLWTLSQTVSNVDFYYSMNVCASDTVVFLKFENNNTGNVTITWDEVFETQAGPGIVGFYGPKVLTLAPGITEQVDCVATIYPDCLILTSEVSPAYPAVILSFGFANVTVN